MTTSPKQLLREKLESRLRIKFNNIVKAFERNSYPSEEAKALALKRNRWIAKKILRRHRYVKILDLMENKRFIFQKTSKSKREGDYLEWLMSQNEREFRREAAVVLYRLDISGGASGAHRTAAHCGISVGSVVDYTRRFFNAILSLKTEWIFWLEHEEREIGVAGFPNCLGFIDGSTIPLEFRPKYRDEEFYTRIANFAIRTLAVCDHRRKISNKKTGEERRDSNKDDTAVYNDEYTASGHERRNALMEYLIARNCNKRQ
ncbi:hypothetical protein BD770DRAFT_417031 [Pilaira anomala]|nr:hypothetical protein BD770DRAFT_417031 [Pilaira anomala]